MKRSNLIPITRIYDIYPKYTYSKDVRRFMDDIVDIDRADVYSKEEVLAMLTELHKEINEEKRNTEHLHYADLESAEGYNVGIDNSIDIIQDRIDKLRGE